MLDKTLFLLLFSLINSQIVNLTVFKLIGTDNILIAKTTGLVCYELNNDNQFYKHFYIGIESDEKDTKIDKTILYKFTESSCKDSNTLPIDLSNLKSEFTDTNSKPKVIREDSGFDYEYKIAREDLKKKFFLMLFRDYTGQNLLIKYNLYGSNSTTIIIIVVAAISLLIIAIVITVGCLICCSGRKRNKSSDIESTSNQKAYPLYPAA